MRGIYEIQYKRQMEHGWETLLIFENEDAEYVAHILDAMSVILQPGHYLRVIEE